MLRSRITAPNSAQIKKMVMASMFCALAFASIFLLRINVVFLTFDAKDAIVTLAALLLGPLYALGISIAVPLLEFLTLGDTGIWGLVMDILSTASFACTCGLIYRYKKTIKGAIVGLLLAVAAMTSAMLLFNLFIVPLYQPGMTTEAVAGMIPSLFLPFNLTKGFLNSALVMILYKPMSRALKAVKMLPSAKPTEAGESVGGRLAFSLAITAVGVVIATLCILVFTLFLGGSFS